MMSISYTDIYKTLLTKLSGISGLPSVVYENRSDAAVDSPYLLVDHTPLIPSYNTLNSAEARQDGYLRVEIVCPERSGWATGYGFLDILVAAFERGTILNSTGYNIRIVKSYPMPPIKGDGIYEIVFVVKYYAYI